MYFFKLLFVIFAIATFLKPACFDILGFNTINTFLNISRIFVAGIIFINYLFIKRKPLSRLLKYECLFFSFWFISTLIIGEGFSQLSVFSISIIAFTMLIELLIAQNVKILINALFINYFILITVNFIYMISVFGFTINIEENARYLFDFYQENAMVSLLSSVNGTASFLFSLSCFMQCPIIDVCYIKKEFFCVDSYSRDFFYCIDFMVGDLSCWNIFYSYIRVIYIQYTKGAMD